MSRPRLELKVGIFVFLSLALVGALLIRFSKGTTFFRPTYELVLKAVNAGGLKPKASVLMSGVQVGMVSHIELGNEGTNVTITAQIYGQYVIRDDARFVIEQSGFLGDQFIAVYPDKNAGHRLPPGAMVQVEAPFNLQEVARSAAGFIKRIDETARRINDVIDELQRQVLNPETMSNLASSITNLQRVSDNALTAVDRINALITTNAAPINIGVSNLMLFSERLNELSQSARSMLDTNQPQISATVSNLQQSSVMLTNFLANLKTSEGLMGRLVGDQALADDVATLADNLSVFSANLRSNSLWHVLFHKPKPPATPVPPTTPKYPEVPPKKQN
jgi:phospholipid/cholesterol/gamma-HCH transport system substrate-binding protein